MIFAKWSTQAPICKYQSIGNLLICNKSCRPFWNARRNYLFRSEKVLCYSSGNFQQVARCFVSKMWTAPTPRLVETMVGRKREANYGATSRTPPAPPSPIFVKKQGVAPGGLDKKGRQKQIIWRTDLLISRSEVNFDSQQITTQHCQYTALHCQCTVSRGVTQVDVYSAQCIAHSERKTHNTLCTAHATGLCVRAYVTLSWTSWDVVVLTFEEVDMVTSRELDSLSSFNISRLR